VKNRLSSVIIKLGQGLMMMQPWDKFDLSGLKTFTVILQSNQTRWIIRIDLGPGKIGQGHPYTNFAKVLWGCILGLNLAGLGWKHFE